MAQRPATGTKPPPAHPSTLLDTLSCAASVTTVNRLPSRPPFPTYRVSHVPRSVSQHVAGPWAYLYDTLRAARPVRNLFLVRASPDQVRFTVHVHVSSHRSRPTPRRRSPFRGPALTSVGVSRPRVSLRMAHVGIHRRARPLGRSAGAGPPPRRTAGTAPAHRPDARAGAMRWGRIVTDDQAASLVQRSASRILTAVPMSPPLPQTRP